MNRCTYIRDSLDRLNLKYVWLVGMLEQNPFGIEPVKTNKTELCDVLAGRRTGDKCEEIIERSCQIINEYEHRMFRTDG